MSAPSSGSREAISIEVPNYFARPGRGGPYAPEGRGAYCCKGYGYGPSLGQPQFYKLGIPVNGRS